MNEAHPDQLSSPEAAVLQAADVVRAAAAGGERTGCVAFTGSGVSSESGIPVFRGNEGLWNGFRAEELATPQAFAADPERVWDWYHWRRSLVLEAEPNAAHRALAALEAHGLITAVVTQNVDGLHQRGGSVNVIELHGSLTRARCTRCQARFAIPPAARGVLMCPRCGSTSRPDIVWFGEVLPEKAWNAAFAAISRAAAMLVIGTSGLVYPAAGLCEMAANSGARLIVINPEPTELENLAVASVREKAGWALPRLARQLLQTDES